MRIFRLLGSALEFVARKTDEVMIAATDAALFGPSKEDISFREFLRGDWWR